jgi:cytoskeletal protein RodZ
MEQKKDSILPIVGGALVAILLIVGIWHFATKKQTKQVIPTPPTPVTPAPTVPTSPPPPSPTLSTPPTPQPTQAPAPEEDSLTAIQNDLNNVSLLDIDQEFQEIDTDLNSL